MERFLYPIMFMLGIQLPLSAQAPPQVTVCELMAKRANYNGQIVVLLGVDEARGFIHSKCQSSEIRLYGYDYPLKVWSYGELSGSEGTRLRLNYCQKCLTVEEYSKAVTRYRESVKDRAAPVLIAIVGKISTIESNIVPGMDNDRIRIPGFGPLGIYPAQISIIGIFSWTPRPNE